MNRSGATDTARSFIEPDMFTPSRNVAWPFGRLVPRAYSLIFIDPPWHFITRSKRGESKSPQAKYRTMTIDDIAALPVADLAADDCLLWMWATAPMVDRQMEILKGWGFDFSSSGVWVKTTVNGRLGFGTGYTFRNCHEIILLGTRGSPEIKSKSVRSVIMAQAREHSRKPDEAYAAARAMIPYGRAADVFSRERRPTWEGFGDEFGKFDTANDGGMNVAV